MNIQPSNSGYNPSNIQQAQTAQQANKPEVNPSVKAAGATELNVGDLERIQGYVEQLKDMSAVRPEKVESAKESLASGEYTKDEVIDQTANRLMDDIFGA